MSGKIIVVQGRLASGKSTFALKLSKELGVPCFIKDMFKTALCKSAPINDRAESSRFSAVTFGAIMYAAERLMEAGIPLIIEGNFVPAGVKETDEAGEIKLLSEKFLYETLTFKFAGDTRVLYDRFIRREKLPERGQANRLFSEPSYEDFAGICENLDRFDIGGPVISVDASDFKGLDFDIHIKAASAFIRETNI